MSHLRTIIHDVVRVDLKKEEGGGRLQIFLIFLKRKASTLPSHAIQQFALFHLTQASFAVIYLSKMSNAFDIFFLTIEIPLFAVTSKSNKTKYFQSFFFFPFFEFLTMEFGLKLFTYSYFNSKSKFSFCSVKIVDYLTVLLL